VPAVPVAINGTGWLGFGRPIRVRVGPAITTDGLDRRRDAALVTQRIHDALAALVADWPDRPPPGPFWRRLTETFNDWPEGQRPDLPTEESQSNVRSVSARRAGPGPSGILGRPIV
jgi:hypothetical protein